MNPEPRKLAAQIRRVINRLIFLEKRSVLRHGGLRLHPSEIHLMQTISEYPDANAGDMARMLGVSNGAVSQTLARLEKKGVIKKHKDTSLKNRADRILYRVRKGGYAAFRGTAGVGQGVFLQLSDRTFQKRTGSDRELSLSHRGVRDRGWSKFFWPMFIVSKNTPAVDGAGKASGTRFLQNAACGRNQKGGRDLSTEDQQGR